MIEVLELFPFYDEYTYASFWTSSNTFITVIILL